jgi:cobalt-zinc-cadmium efflux system outer membrane protein
VGLLLACLAVPVAATPPALSTAPPALRQALQSAWQGHPAARVTEATLEAARARAEAASRPLYNPELELESADEGEERTTTAGVNLTLDLSGKRRARRNSAQATLVVKEAEARLQRRDFAIAWLAGWADLESTRRRVELGEQRLTLIARFADLADKQFAAGDISSLERDLALLARDEAEAEQATLLAEQAEAEEAFRNVGGRPDQAPALPDGPNALPPVTPGTPSLEALPEWQIAQAGATAFEREVAVARRNRIPDPTLGVTGGRVDYGPASDNVVGVSVSVPLFVRNSYRAEVVAAQADATAAAADAERVTLELQSRAQRSAASYAAIRDASSRWRKSRGTDLARRVDLLERLWRAGELSTADYLLQLKQTLDTALAGAELEGRLWRRSTDYLAATGQLERWLGWNDATGELSR